jgi:hypothetical protein
VATGTLNADGEERRRAVCGKIACTVRCGGGRKPSQSGQHRPHGPGASRRPYLDSVAIAKLGAIGGAGVRPVDQGHDPKTPVRVLQRCPVTYRLRPELIEKRTWPFVLSRDVKKLCGRRSALVYGGDHDHASLPARHPDRHSGTNCPTGREADRLQPAPLSSPTALGCACLRCSPNATGDGAGRAHRRSAAHRHAVCGRPGLTRGLRFKQACDGPTCLR